MPAVLSTNVLRHGRDEPPTERIALRAGPLDMIFEPANVFLRYVRLGSQDVLWGIYAALRDEHWGTVRPAVSNLHVVTGDESFDVSFDADCRQGPIDFHWTGRISGRPDGTVRYVFDGQARTKFLRNRIGLCVLHPLACCGLPCVVEHSDGQTDDDRFPEAGRISPHQPFKDIRAIRHVLRSAADIDADLQAAAHVAAGNVSRPQAAAPSGAEVEVRLEGDVFEMEDQRNWTDASFKTYSTPLALPIPAEVPAGTCLRQTVTLRLLSVPAGSAAPVVEVPYDPPPGRCTALMPPTTIMGKRPRMPAIGLALGPGSAAALDEPSIRLLAALGPNHLRVDLHLGGPDWMTELRSADNLASAIGASLELAIHASDPAAELLAQLNVALDTAKAPVARLLLLSEGKPFTTPDLLRSARAWLSNPPDASRPRTGRWDLVVGTDGFFAELNRNFRPEASPRLVCYSATPQVHAFDDATLMETLDGQHETASCAGRFCQQTKVCLSPVTLKRRHPRPPQHADAALPADVDPRQMSLLCAAWTVGSLAAIAGDAASVTYFEVAGPRGVIAPADCKLPPDFPPVAGAVFPVYHVLADILGFQRPRGTLERLETLLVLPCEPLRMAAVGLVGTLGQRLLLANLTGEPLDLSLQPWEGYANVRILDETNVLQAMYDPDAFRAETGTLHQAHDNELDLHLLPYAVARIDCQSRKRK